MSAWLRNEFPPAPCPDDDRQADILGLLAETGEHHTAQVTAAGADWLASAAPFPRSVLSLWTARPTAARVLPCGSVFDVVNVPSVFGRRMLDQLWSQGPGSGPVASHRGRTLLFAAPGTAQRLPALLSWEEWGCSRSVSVDAVNGADADAHDAAAHVAERDGGVPPLLCHGTGDAVTVPALTPATASGPRWVVAPDTRHPWLPGPEVLLWACVRAARSLAGPARRACGPAGPSGAPAHAGRPARSAGPPRPFSQRRDRRRGQ